MMTCATHVIATLGFVLSMVDCRVNIEFVVLARSLRLAAIDGNSTVDDDDNDDVAAVFR